MLRDFLFTTLTALPVQAADLWCMPDTICRNGKCHATTDTESSVRLHDPDGKAPVLRADAEDIPMTKTHNGAVVQWEGVNDFGLRKVLAVQASDYVYVTRHPVGDDTASGHREVQ